MRQTHLEVLEWNPFPVTARSPGIKTGDLSSRCPSRLPCKLWTSSLACGTALWALWPHDSSRLMTQHASWWRLMVAPYDSMFHRCQSCDVAMCFCKFCQDQFDTKVYGIVIQSLVEEPGPLPTLFMRTVIQVVCSPSHWNILKRRVWKTQMRDTKGISSECFKDLQVGSKGYLERLQEAFEVKELPRLSDFIVMEILPRLVRQEVWGDENMWCFP